MIFFKSKSATLKIIVLCTLGFLTQNVFADEIGVSQTSIRIGGVLDLEGQSRGLGQGMRTGILAALANEKVQGKRIDYVTLNDSYSPPLTERATKQLIDDGIFLMLGNVGTPTAKVSLPILAENKVPAVGFFTGAGILRPGIGDIINFRASYVEETAAVIHAALNAGVKTAEICAYVQNDAYGMAGVEGIKRAIINKRGARPIVEKLDQLLAMKGANPARNNLGPVGVYQRNTLSSKAGYDSLKNWERTQDVSCKIVVSVGTYNAIGRFAGYSRYKGDQWIISAVSFTGADNLKNVLSEFGVNSGVLVTQVVPNLDENLAILKEARRKLGEDYGYVSLEGFLVGKMLLSALRDIRGEITREKFLTAVRGKKFDLGGVSLNFRSSNQGSTLVTMIFYDNGEYRDLREQEIKKII